MLGSLSQWLTLTRPLLPCHQHRGYTGLTLPSTNNTIPGLERDLWPLQIGEKWPDTLSKPCTQKLRQLLRKHDSMFTGHRVSGRIWEFDWAVMVTWCVYLVFDNFLVLKVDCCKISGAVSNSVTSLGSHSPWHKTTELPSFLSWAPSWQHQGRDAPFLTCTRTKTVRASDRLLPKVATVALVGSVHGWGWG